MKSLVFCLLFSSGSFLACKTVDSQENSSEVKFYGTDSKKAEMTFKTEVEITLTSEQAKLSADKLKTQMKDEIDEHIRVQLTHLFGAFSIHTIPFDFVQNPGIPREKPEITNIKAKKIQNNVLTVSYDYKDIVAFKKDVFKDPNSDSRSISRRNIQFYLPKSPGPEGTEIYAMGCQDQKIDEDGCVKGHNLCTDHHYNSIGDFWYFWDPFMNQGTSKECTIKPKHLTKVTANLRALPSTTNTYPDYFRLYPQAGERRALKITYLVGIDENFKNGDLGKSSFQKSFTFLTKGRGMLNTAADRAKLQPGEIKLLESTPDVVFNVDVDDLRHKRLTYHNDKLNYNVIVNMYLVNPNQNKQDQNRPDNYSFPDKAVDGMRESDIFIYDGHSGLGGYLSVGRLFAKRTKLLPVDRYQIFFFNGCSTFSYYNADYFDLKKVSKSEATSPDKIDLEGSKNLDIITTSIGALFDNGAGNDSIFIRSLASGEQPSWQTIIDRIYAVAPDGSALTHVNGDEDNPKRPTGRCSTQKNQWQNPTSCECQQQRTYHPESGYCRL